VIAMRAIPREVIRFGLPFLVLAFGRFLGAPEHPFAAHPAPPVQAREPRAGREAILLHPLGAQRSSTGAPVVTFAWANEVRAAWSDTTRVRFRAPPVSPTRF
jgi:hypothetical protein